ncbi:MAG: hypothetical protein QXL86_00940 [Candidatus Aenigmatarchaeota archaeon]
MEGKSYKKRLYDFLREPYSGPEGEEIFVTTLALSLTLETASLGWLDVEPLCAYAEAIAGFMLPLVLPTIHWIIKKYDKRMI